MSSVRNETKTATTTKTRRKYTLGGCFCSEFKTVRSSSLFSVDENQTRATVLRSGRRTREKESFFYGRHSTIKPIVPERWRGPRSVRLNDIYLPRPLSEFTVVTGYDDRTLFLFKIYLFAFLFFL